MTIDSNLSKIKPKLRTEGRVSGNFGKNKVRAGSTLVEIGETTVETVRITPRSQYIERMLAIYLNPPSASMREFAYHELHRLNHIKQTRIQPGGRTADPFRGPVGVR